MLNTVEDALKTYNIHVQNIDFLEHLDFYHALGPIMGPMGPWARAPMGTGSFGPYF